MQYRVTYEIDVDANNPLEAALIVENHMRHGHYRPFLSVRNFETHITTSIDLDEEAVVTE